MDQWVWPPPRPPGLLSVQSLAEVHTARPSSTTPVLPYPVPPNVGGQTESPQSLWRAPTNTSAALTITSSLRRRGPRRRGRPCPAAMALWQTPSRMLDTTEHDVSPKTANPLENTVFHARADIRIESTSQLTSGLALPIEGNDQLLEQSSPTEEEKANQKHADSMRIWWDSAIVKHMDLPDGYRSAAVMIVKWVDELDELKTRDEVSLCLHSLTPNMTDQLCRQRS